MEERKYILLIDLLDDIFEINVCATFVLKHPVALQDQGESAVYSGAINSSKAPWQQLTA